MPEQLSRKTLRASLSNTVLSSLSARAWEHIFSLIHSGCTELDRLIAARISYRRSEDNLSLFNGYNALLLLRYSAAKYRVTSKNGHFCSISVIFRGFFKKVTSKITPIFGEVTSTIQPSMSRLINKNALVFEHLLPLLP